MLNINWAKSDRKAYNSNWNDIFDKPEMCEDCDNYISIITIGWKGYGTCSAHFGTPIVDYNDWCLKFTPREGEI